MCIPMLYSSDAELAVRLINEKRFMGSVLRASLAPTLNRVLITHLQQNVDEDRVVLHLEQRKVTSISDVEVTVDEFDVTNGVAIVTFSDASGRPASSILWRGFSPIVLFHR